MIYENIFGGIDRTAQIKVYNTPSHRMNGKTGGTKSTIAVGSIKPDREGCLW